MAGLILLFILMFAAIAGTFLIAPTEATMGDIQRIFYFHVPSAWVSFAAFFVIFICSIGYLATRKDFFDRAAHTSGQTGILFATFVLVTGPLWARPVWGIWWTWDARLTSMLVLWFIYMAYLLVRRFVIDPEKRKILAAITGICGFVDVPIVHFSIRWWRTQHPAPVMDARAGSGIDPLMLKVLLVSTAAFLALYYVLARLSASILLADEEVEKLSVAVRNE